VFGGNILSSWELTVFVGTYCVRWKLTEFDGNLLCSWNLLLSEVTYCVWWELTVVGDKLLCSVGSYCGRK